MNHRNSSVRSGRQATYRQTAARIAISDYASASANERKIKIAIIRNSHRKSRPDASLFRFPLRPPGRYVARATPVRSTGNVAYNQKTGPKTSTSITFNLRVADLARERIAQRKGSEVWRPRLRITRTLNFVETAVRRCVKKFGL